MIPFQATEVKVSSCNVAQMPKKLGAETEAGSFWEGGGDRSAAF